MALNRQHNEGNAILDGLNLNNHVSRTYETDHHSKHCASASVIEFRFARFLPPDSNSL